jgi:hypothetical protein
MLIKETIKKKNEKTGEMEVRYLYESKVGQGSHLIEKLDTTNNPGKPGCGSSCGGICTGQQSGRARDKKDLRAVPWKCR